MGEAGHVSERLKVKPFSHCFARTAPCIGPTWSHLAALLNASLQETSMKGKNKGSLRGSDDKLSSEKANRWLRNLIAA